MPFSFSLQRKVMISLLFLYIVSQTVVESFQLYPIRMETKKVCLRATIEDASSESDDSDLFQALNEDINSDTAAILDEIKWRSKKVELEEENTRRFQKTLKRKPWKLPLEEASVWVQKNLGVDTKEEYLDLVANGNLRTPYIPKDPERYYTENGTWISWDHFLHGK